MTPPIFTRLEGGIPIARHEHIAVLYRSGREPFDNAPFITEGLARGDFVFYLAPPTFHAPMLEHARAQTSGVDRALRSGQLRIQQGSADFATLRATCQRVFVDAEDARAPAVRWLEEGIWPEPAGFPMPDFFEFHALLNYQVKHYPSVALCKYDLDRFDVRCLFQAIAVHRHLIVEGNLVRDNPFYIPAEKFIPLSPRDRERDLVQLFCEVGFDMSRLLAALAGYGRLHDESPAL